MPYREAVNQFEYRYFERLLLKHKGINVQAAKQADLSREWFTKKVKQLGLRV
jgi:DNA-binding NtrC family response regulator